MSSQGEVYIWCNNAQTNAKLISWYRYLSTFHGKFERKSGGARLAINEWISYYNVLLNPLDLMAGHEYIIKVKPVQHIATQQIKDYDVQSRKCLFPEENKVCELYSLP